jgi:hypothetical protein
VWSFTAPADDRWGERTREAFEAVRHRRHLEALDQSPVLGSLAESLDRAWVAVQRAGPTERFFLNDAALTVCRLAGVELPRAARTEDALPGSWETLSAGDLASVPGPGPARHEQERAMAWRELIIDGYDRLPDLMKEVLGRRSRAELDRQPHRDCNSLGWTAWHLTRVQDSQIAELAGEAQLWITDGWHRRFRRPADPDDTGYGHTPAEVRAFRSPSATVQLDYLRATVERTKRYLAALAPSDLERELDEPWQQPPPTVGIRIVSILADCHQHAGEASYIRGLLEARGAASR